MTYASRKTPIGTIVNRFCPDLKYFKDACKDFHLHPELSTQERRTADVAADFIEGLGYSVMRRIGGYGVVGVLGNGQGPTVLLRAEMDALLIEENIGLPYASKARMKDTDGIESPVSHIYGDDIHVACVIAAAKPLLDARQY